MVRHHGAHPIVAVGISQRGFTAVAVVAGTHADVFAAADGAEGKLSWLGIVDGIAVTREIVDGTDGREVKHAAQLVVERHTVDVCLAVDVLIATRAEAHI